MTCLLCGRTPQRHPAGCKAVWLPDPQTPAIIREITKAERDRQRRRDFKRYWTYQKAYRRLPTTKARHRVKDLAYSKRPEVIAWRLAYRRTPESIARKREYDRARKKAAHDRVQKSDRGMKRRQNMV